MCRLSAPVPLGTTMEPCEEFKYDINSSNEFHVGDGTEAIALDCEMVAGGSDGSLDLCARVCLVDEDETILFHTYVQPQDPVINYRYEVTGLTEEHLRDGMPLQKVQDKVLQILYNGKTKHLVGHSLENDLDCLRINHPDYLLRYKSFFFSSVILFLRYVNHEHKVSIVFLDLIGLSCHVMPWFSYALLFFSSVPSYYLGHSVWAALYICKIDGVTVSWTIAFMAVHDEILHKGPALIWDLFEAVGDSEQGYRRIYVRILLGGHALMLYKFVHASFFISDR